MNQTGIALEEVVAERLYEALNKALPKIRSRDKADLALSIVNTLADLQISELANFNKAMVDFITLPKESKEHTLSRLCVKITEFKVV